MLKTTDPSRYAPANGADYARSAFGQALKQIAQLTKANLGVEVAFADLGGWDTHINQGAAQGQLATRLDDFARGIAALTTDLGDRMEDTVVLTMSEFGRAVSENGNRGTDHGHGNAMLVMGGGVNGGHVFGKWPGLAVAQRFEGRDLAVTTDFRCLRRDCRPPSRHQQWTIFPGYTAKHGFLVCFVAANTTSNAETAKAAEKKPFDESRRYGGLRFLLFSASAKSARKGRESSRFSSPSPKAPRPVRWPDRWRVLQRVTVPACCWMTCRRPRCSSIAGGC